jgi:dCTP deaminase
MGWLSDRDIRYQLKSEQLVIKPLLEPIQPASVDLRLSDEIIFPKGGHIIDPVLGLGTTDKARKFDVYNLSPGECVLGSTLEWVEVPPHLMGFLVGKSTLARFWLQVEAAGLVDPGWKGRLTLEIKNLGNDVLVLRPGMPICQIYFLSAFMNPPEHVYGDEILKSRYQGSEGPRPGQVVSPWGPEQEANEPD